MCIFCDIIEGKIPSSVIYEDEQVMAFLDISQVTRGHTLVIPKKHVDSFMECDDETLAHLMKTARMLAVRIMEKTGAAGMKDMGKVMGTATKRLAGRADGKDISAKVKELLA